MRSCNVIETMKQAKDFQKRHKIVARVHAELEDHQFIAVMEGLRLRMVGEPEQVGEPDAAQHEEGA